jgi:hypothetical protein
VQVHPGIFAGTVRIGGQNSVGTQPLDSDLHPAIITS